ncbi:DUF6215 domain-containing protein [Kitasatospora sp. NPDC057518]|uniref:DUF6215 domain-containing protein n=1 Tax=Kitasatospora sp. NPDC057518 TaxID=3346155 RepID=UPI0036C131C8
MASDAADTTDAATTADIADIAGTTDGDATTGTADGTGTGAGARKRGGRPGLRTAAAAALAVALLGGLWGLGFLHLPKPGHEPGGPGKPAECAAPRPTDKPGYPALCAALNRPDLPALLGTPEDRVTVAQPAPITFGTDVMAEVRLTHTVVSLLDSSTSLEDTHDMRRVYTWPATVLGHPAATYWSNATSVIPGGKLGPATRNIVVAQDPAAPGGRAFEVVVFRDDGLTPDEATLTRLAETVLPTVPGWVPAP